MFDLDLFDHLICVRSRNELCLKWNSILPKSQSFSQSQQQSSDQYYYYTQYDVTSTVSHGDDSGPGRGISAANRKNMAENAVTISENSLLFSVDFTLFFGSFPFMPPTHLSPSSPFAQLNPKM